MAFGSFCAAVVPAAAQHTSWSVSTADDLTKALHNASNNNVTDPTVVNTITLAGNISGSSQWFVNANLNIVGNGYTIDMNNADRAFFIAGGTVGVNDLTITNGNARGGTGGAGNGLGGGIFVGSGAYTTGDGSTVSGISATQVTISNVIFSGNQANGGTGGNASLSAYAGMGGGGGMGGDGGAGASFTAHVSDGGGTSFDSYYYWAGGGGGFGMTAFGGSAAQGQGVSIVGGNGLAGSFVSPPLYAGAGAGPDELATGIQGGYYGGGGGVGGMILTGVGGNPGGGGGVGGSNATGYSGGQGGFGGGGGASQYGAGGGGFGGGGAGSQNNAGGTGGFGGGGGGSSISAGQGGFGAGAGDSNGYGGGGLGAGGAIFVMQGASLTIQNSSISAGSVSGGASGGGSAGVGYALGSGIFYAGGNLNYEVTSGTSTVSDSISDGVIYPVSLTKTGSGTLVLSNPANDWRGLTQVQAGVLEVYTVSLPEVFPVSVSANANLTFGSVANTSGNFTGDIIGNGSVTIGDATNLGAGGVITLSGGNTYSGGTVVNGSTLRTGGAQAFGVGPGGLSLWSSTASGTSGTVNGATVDVNGFSITVAGLTGDGRALVTNSSTTAATLTVTGSSSQYQGQISGPIALAVESTGTFTLSGNSTYSGATNVDGGTLMVSGTLGGLAAGVTVANGAALGGTGVINRSVAVESGGTVAAGLGTLTVDSLVLENGSNLWFSLGAAGSPSVIVQGGLGLDLGKNVTLFLTTGTGFGAGVYPLINSYATIDQSNGFSGWSIVGLPSAYSATFEVGQAYDAHPGLSLVVAVPEPSTLVLVAAGVIAVAGWHVRRSGPNTARRHV